MGEDVLIRKVKEKKVVKVELDKDRRVGSLKKKLIKDLDYQAAADLTLSYRGRRMSDDRRLDFYGIEENDMLVLEKDQNSHLSPDLEAVQSARDWLKENIGLAEAELRDYIKTGGGEREMMFEFENEIAKLSLSEGKVKDYGLVSSDNM